MPYSGEFPVGRRVRFNRSCVYESVPVARGERGVVTKTGEGVDILLDNEHLDLADNIIHFSEWGVMDPEAVEDLVASLSRDWLHPVRELFKDTHRLATACVLLVGAGAGLAFSSALDGETTPPPRIGSTLQRIVLVEGVPYRFTVRREHVDLDDPSKSVLSILEVDTIDEQEEPAPSPATLADPSAAPMPTPRPRRTTRWRLRVQPYTAAERLLFDRASSPN